MLCFLADGAPLSELSWSSSLAVVAVSFSGIFTVIILMLACLCCKKGGIGFKVRTSHRIQRACYVHPPSVPLHLGATVIVGFSAATWGPTESLV